MRYLELGKRTFDFIAAAVALVLLSPVLLIVSIVTFLAHGWPVLFTQQRPGLRGEAFTIIKFRTMKGTRDAAGELLPDHLRMTRVGRFLRSSSLDELPELINVLRGDMSLVGPRPLMMEYLPLYSADQARRHDVRPGITGLAQVRGRNALTWEQKFDYDLEYVRDRSLRLDLSILAATVVEVFRATGINADETTTMPEFWGSPPPPEPAAEKRATNSLN